MVNFQIIIVLYNVQYSEVWYIFTTINTLTTNNITV